jgi:ribose transport system ATP-binding protein
MSATDQKTLLRMRAIGKSFGGVAVLRGVEFELRAGEVHILAGENGAGKSTLIKILGGVHADYDGSIELAGSPVRFTSPHDAARQGIAVIHQEMSLIGPMSVADNIFLGREIMQRWGGVNFAAQRSRSAELLRQFGVQADPDQAVDSYPLSVQQMIEIAKALACESRIIVMDEPTSALTDPEVEKLFAIIGDLKARGCGIIYISHKMQEIYRVADRITVLRDGDCIGTRAASDLPEAELVRMMVGREITRQFVPRTASPGSARLQVDRFQLMDPAGTGRLVVNNVSFSVRAGEILGFAGLQGSGNSELLNGIFGVYGRPASGGMTLDGQAIEVTSPRAAIRHGLALLTNDRKSGGLVLGMTIRHNITLAGLAGFSPAGWLLPGREKSAAQGYKDDLRIKSTSVDQEVGFLSGGNQQKVVLAKWLATRPKVLLLDEPTRGVDVGAKHEIYELMNRWTAEGVSILLITSEMPELLAMSDRILVMHRGQVTAAFDRGKATQEDILRAAMGIQQTPETMEALT